MPHHWGEVFEPGMVAQRVPKVCYQRDQAFDRRLLADGLTKTKSGHFKVGRVSKSYVPILRSFHDPLQFHDPLHNLSNTQPPR